MNFQGPKEMNFTAILPKYINDSLLCYTFVNTKVVDKAPDITTCNTNGYLYEVKNKKILRSLNLEDNALSVSCYYLSENEKLVLFYLVFTKKCKLLVIRRNNNTLKIVQAFDKIKEFQVNDFECLGFLKMKIVFLSDFWSLISKFPVERHAKAENIEDESAWVVSLTQQLEELRKHIDDLTEEYDQLKKLCFFNDSSTNVQEIFVSSVLFFSHSRNDADYKLMVCNKWFKVLGTDLVLGMRICNTGREIIHDIEVIINHAKIENYSLSFFQCDTDIACCLFTRRKVNLSLQPGQEICALAVFDVPAFFAESDLFIPCYVTCANSKDYLLKETFEVTVSDIASQSTLGLEDRFTVQDLMAVQAVKSETRLRIQTEDLEDGLMESILTKNLGFKMIRHVKDKLFYCTSTYLKEVFVGLQHVAVNPTVWKMLVFARVPLLLAHQIIFQAHSKGIFIVHLWNIKKTHKKRLPKERMSSVASGELCQQYFLNKIRKKEEREAERKRKREEKEKAKNNTRQLKLKRTKKV